MAVIFIDPEISGLIQEPKPLPPDYRVNIQTRPKRGHKERGGVVGGVPVFPVTEKQKAPIIKLVQTILADSDSPSVPQLESEIDHFVYGLYNLNPAEIVLIDKTDEKP